jgi:hypothetical protein
MTLAHHTGIFSVREVNPKLLMVTNPDIFRVSHGCIECTSLKKTSSINKGV